MNYVIRPMNENDWKEVQQVVTTSWHDTYAGIVPLTIQDNFLKLAYNEEMLLHRVRTSYFFVAEVDGQLIGFANFSYLRKSENVELIAIYLLKEFHGKGIGSALLNKAIQSIEGLKKIYVTVEKENQFGFTFYLAKGFEIISEFDDLFDGHLLKSVRMELNI